VYGPSLARADASTAKQRWSDINPAAEQLLVLSVDDQAWNHR
jgi:hypothetical protein